MPSSPRQITLDEFGRRLRDHLARPDCRVVWFLGAGCSVSSGIPGTTGLVNQWLPRLKRYEQGDDGGWEEWATARFPAYNESPALVYGEVIEALFPTRSERQQEVERLTSGKEPGIGYALLALLMAHDEHGQRANVVLTTNFDDLIADALYLLTPKKPLVVAHESLASFARASESRPLVVKVHGDARLAPRNTADETAALDEGLRAQVVRLFQGCLLVFCGYGGNDRSIAAMVRDADRDAFPFGIYWIGSEFPRGAVGDALSTREPVFHIAYGDFDKMMIALSDQLAVELPDFDRWKSLFDRYQASVERRVADAPPGPAQRSASRLRSRFEGWGLAAQANTIADKDPERAEELYQRAVDADPTNPSILGAYAVFLKNVRKDAERAEESYRRALDADPDNANNLANYALFLETVRQDPERAEEFYRRALDADPGHINNIRNYAAFLQRVRNDPQRAEEFYRRAVDADPSNPNSLGSYAAFLHAVRKDLERAEDLYRRALDADPNDAIILSNYGAFLFATKNDPARAEEVFRRALDADPSHPNSLANYAQLLFANGHDEEALRRCDAALSAPSIQAATRLEAGYYLVAHVPSRSRAALSDVRDLIDGGVRSVGWDFKPNLDRVRAEGDERLPFLTALADVSTGTAPPNVLDEFAEWAGAKADT